MSALLKKISLFIITFAISAAAMRNFDLVFTDVACRVHDRTLVSEARCQLSQLQHNGRPLSTLNLSYAIGRAAHNWHLRTVLHVVRSKAPEAQQRESLQKLVDVDVNICDFLSANTSLHILLIARKALERFANEMPKCPLKQNFSYSFANLHFSPSDYPSYTPEGSFKISLNFHEADKNSFDVDIWVDVVYRRNVWQKFKSQRPKSI